MYTSQFSSINVPKFVTYHPLFTSKILHFSSLYDIIYFDYLYRIGVKYG